MHNFQSPAAADFVFYPVLKIFLRTADKFQEGLNNFVEGSFEKQWPATANWVAGIERLSGYANTYPTHWRE